MDQDRTRRALKLFEELQGLGAERRQAALLRICAVDEALGREVQQLLDQDAGTVGIDRRMEAVREREATGLSEPLPDRIGSYRIVGLLGKGGMGLVYRGEQEHPRRPVAIKVLRPSPGMKVKERRLRREAEILGRLQHPGIAQVLEAGTWETPDGSRPFLVLELVEGQDLMRWVESRQPAIDERVAVFLQVCAAVHHAHQRGVIHRDLKPGNILVGHGDQPKVLDFGISRLLDRGEPFTLQTAPDQVLGTLPYMAPEELAQGDRDPDIRVDVYALGVILHELLSGRRPLDVSSVHLAEAARVIQEEVPAPLGRWDRRLRGDLEVITARCLEKDPRRRYVSVASLSEDLVRSQEHLPIRARPPSAAYQLSRFARRHRGLVAGLALAFLVAVVGVVEVVDHAWQADRERAVAVRERQLSEDLNGFLMNMFLSIQPHAAQGRDIRVRELVDSAAQQIESESWSDPLLHASLRYMLGETYGALQRPDLAIAHLTRAVELRRQAGAAHAELADSLGGLGDCLLDLGRPAEASAVFRELLALAEGTEDTQQVRRAEALYGLSRAAYQRFEYDPCLALLQEAETCVHGADAPTLQSSLLIFRAQVLVDLARYGEALASVRTVQRAMGGVAARPTLQQARLLESKARILTGLGSHEEALLASRECAEVVGRLLGPDHPLAVLQVTAQALMLRRLGRDLPEELSARLRSAYEVLPRYRSREVALAWNNLGLLAEMDGRFGDAGVFYRRSLEEFEGVLGPGVLEQAFVRQNLGVLNTLEGRLDEAIEGLEESLAVKRRVLGSEDPRLVATLRNLAYARILNGRSSAAVAPAEEALALARLKFPADHREVAKSRSMLGWALTKVDRVQEGEAHLRAAREVLERDGPSEAETLYCLHRLAQCLAQGNQAQEARELYRHLAQRYPTIERAGARHAAHVLNELGVLLFRQGDVEDACGAWRESLEWHRRAEPPDVLEHMNVLSNLGAVHRMREEWPQAIDCFREALSVSDPGLDLLHPTRVAICKALAQAYESMGRLSQSILVWEDLARAAEAGEAGRSSLRADALAQVERLRRVLDGGEGGARRTP